MSQSTPETDADGSVNLFVARARLDLDARPFFAKLAPAEQDRQVDELACRIALAESPIGKFAALAARHAGLLADAYAAFLAHYPTADAATQAGTAALAMAGLAGHQRREYTGSYFGKTPDEFRALLYLTQLTFPRLEHCDPPELIEPVEEPRVA